MESRFVVSQCCVEALVYFVILFLFAFQEKDSGAWQMPRTGFSNA